MSPPFLSALHPLKSPHTWTGFSGSGAHHSSHLDFDKFASSQVVSSGLIPAPHQGFLAPDFSLQTPEGKAVRLSDLRGRPVLVNLWASWCIPCKAEMQNIQSVYLAYRDEGLEVLAVNVTSPDSAEAAVTFINQEKLTFPILFDPEAVVSQKYQMQALPSTYFIDKKGVIREVVLGGPMSEALLRTQVERLLEEP